jgi:hypothetical protein
MAFAAKRESPHLSKGFEFSGEKCELVATNSLMGRLTQIERVSNLISSYLRRIRNKTLCLTRHFRPVLGLNVFAKCPSRLPGRDSKSVIRLT